ncbi:DNA gyrase subunit A [Kytococcus sedentarius]|uniref:DNA gyrase subunit A n=1 Tax=Kytococcus sedentarius (strain ATCC 14392 / DSM 20547 / JCM 11482 / CCUG 33030 / NBRC 15357 / NCTC 11040 / CCM 314 / 541) TaxID=478801 RepID=C7NID6_KYTSD|nr:DNA gyrase subunit A [Kytococcus sedentarius DSM 20547]QQB63582.1 DNA gyrase subunit A [Kytococcus sedentarius]STX13489.1 DNA gyrase subunit A [Kytococcus sedentarius]
MSEQPPQDPNEQDLPQDDVVLPPVVNNGPEIPQHGRIEPVDLSSEMQRSYIEYAMSVIVSRALPDVRDGLKPVHRRIVYAMYDGGYRPDRSYNKCARVVGDVMANYHPHGDSAIYDAMVRLSQPWSMRYPLIDGQGNFGSAGDDGPAAPRYTECRMQPLAMELVRDITEDTVDFEPNYDGRTMQPTVLPARFPNLLVNGSAGIAVGMATQIPPHNLREVAEGCQWLLDNPEATKEELQEKLLQVIKGPDFPTGALIMGRSGIEDAYRTGRGSITMRAVVEVEEIQGRTCLVVTELPYQVNPDALARKIAELVKTGKLQGIADLRDETSGRTGQRLVIVLKRDAVAKVVLNNLYKHTQLQQNFGANMLALVDGVPRTLPINAFVRHWVDHQVEVIVRRTRYRLKRAEEQIHILRGLLKALDALDEVIALIRRSPTVEQARDGLMDLLDIDEVQARAILDMQLRRLAALERQKIIDEHDRLQALIEDLEDILATPARQRTIISEELAAIVEQYGDERRTEIVPSDAEVNMEDLIPDENVVVTITRGGYAKRIRVDAYRSQRRGGKGVRGTTLRADDVVDHFFTTQTHGWLLFFTDAGRVYRARAWELPEGSRDSKGQHVANIMAFGPDEKIAQVLTIKDYQAAPYLVLATKNGLVKKTRLTEYDSPRSGGLIAVNLREGDELVGAELVSDADDILMVSRKGQSLRFTASDDQIRPMGRATSGVTGMRFRGDDELLAMRVVPSDAEDAEVFVVFQSGMAKRTAVDQYRVQGRGGLGVKVAKASDKGGDLVGALVVGQQDEVMVVMSSGKVVRSRVDEVRMTGRDTSGVRFADPGKKEHIVAVARTHAEEEEAAEQVADAEAEQAAEAQATAATGEDEQ